MRKVVVLLVAGLLIGGTAQAAQASSFSVSIKASKSTLELGGSFSLSGKVSPSAKGKTVKIQRRLGTGSWKTMKNVKLNSHSTYAYTVRPTTGGAQQYRVQKPKAGKRHTKTSTTRTVNVWRWRPLSDFPVSTTRNPGTTVINGTSIIAGQTFSASTTVSSPTTTADAMWTIGNANCNALSTFIGIDDRSSDGGLATPTFFWNINSPTPLPFQGGQKNTDLPKGQNPRFFQEPIPSGTSTMAVHELFKGAVVYLTLGTPQLHCLS